MKRWTSQEDGSLVHGLLSGQGLDGIANELGRTLGAIEQRALRLGMVDRFRQPVRELPLTWRLSSKDSDAMESFKGFLARFLPGEIELRWDGPDDLFVSLAKEPPRILPGDATVLDAGESTDPVAEVDTTQLFRRLKEWRLAKAKELKWAAYMVAWDSKLESICQVLPETVEELGRIPGLSARLRTEFAPEIVAIVKAWKVELAPAIQELIGQTEPGSLHTEEPDEGRDAEFICAPGHQVLLGMAASEDFHWHSRHPDAVIRDHWKQYVTLWGQLLTAKIEPQTADECRVLDFLGVLETGAGIEVTCTWERALQFLCQNIHAHTHRLSDEYRPVDEGERFFPRDQQGRLGATARRYFKQRK